MSSSVPKLKQALRKRLRSSDSPKRNIQSDDGEKGKKTANDDGSVKMSPVFLEKEKEKEKGKKRLNNNNSKNKMPTDDSKEGEKKIYNEVKNGKASPTYFKNEKRKEELKVSSSRSNMQTDEDVKEEEMEIWNDQSKKRRKVSTVPYERGEERKRSSNVKEKTKKMPSQVEKKINGAGRNTSLLVSKNNIQNTDAKNRSEPITSAVNKKKMRPYENTEMKMQHDVKKKETTVPSDMSKMKKTKAPVDCNNEKRKREESNTSFKEGKRMQSEYNKKKHSGKVKEKNCGDGEERRRTTPFSFFKVICNNFKEYMYIPPKVAPELEDLTNHHVNLEDSEGNNSKIRLSVVDGFLAFHQGWNMFVSDHLIKWGDFLLFEYTAKSTFSVRIFGRDSRERLYFDAGKKREGVGNKGMHTNRSRDDLILFDVKSEDSKGCCFSEEYPRDKEPGTHYVTVHTAEDPERVEHMVESGPVPLDIRNGNEVIRQCRTKGMSPPRSKEKGVGLITDSGSSVQDNDIVKLIASTADSDTHHMAADTNEYPKMVQSGVVNGQSAVVGVADGRLTDVGCITKCTSLKCSEKKAASSVQIGIEYGPSAVAEDGKGSLPYVECVTKRASLNCSEKKGLSVNEAPLAHENDDTLKDDLNLHNADENLRSKQGISFNNLQCTLAVNKCNNDGEMKFSPNVCRNYEAPGGFRCLEKWKNSILRYQAVLDGTRLTQSERTRETNRKKIVEYGAVGLNPGDKCILSKDTHACSEQIFTMPIKDPACPDKVSRCNQDTTESNHSADRKGQNPVRSEGTCAFIKNPSNPDRISKFGDSRTEIKDDIDEKGTIAKLETNMEHLEALGSIVGTQTTNIHVCANHGAACQPENSFLKQEDTNPVDFSTPTKPEILESDDRSVLMVNMQFCISNTTMKWLELPKLLSNAVRQKRQDRNVIMLKDPMKRLWPVLYHENSIFVGFTAGWKPFSAANNLQIGDLCELFKEPGDEEPVYSVQITKK